MKRRTMISGLAAAAVAFTLPIAIAAPAQAIPAAAPGSYQSVSPVRVLDTRYGIGADKATIAPLSTVTFTLPESIPSAAGSVLLEVTVVNPTAPGYATVFGAGATRPVVSNINFQLGQNVPNTVIVQPSSTRSISIFNGSKGTVDLLADVQGYFQSGQNQGDVATFVPVSPTRALDTRIGLGAVKGKVAPHSITTLQITGGLVPTGASSVAVNLTAVAAGGKGYLTAFAGATRPEESTVNFVAGENRANLTLTGLNPDGSVSVYNGSQYPIDLLADVTGYFVGVPPTESAIVDGAYFPINGRVVDTRKDAAGSVPSLATLNVPIFNTGSPFKAVAVNVTAVQPQAAGFLTTWDGATTVPAVSNVNFRPLQDSAGSVVVPLNTDGSISIYNGSFGNVDIIVDLTGVFTTAISAPTSMQAQLRAALGSHQKPTIIRHH